MLLLKETHAALGTDEVSPLTQQALAVFLEPLDFSVPSRIPLSLPLSLRVRKAALQHEDLLQAAEAAATAAAAAGAAAGGEAGIQLRPHQLIDKLVGLLEEEEAAARRQAATGSSRETGGDALRLEGLEAEIEGEEQQQQEEEQVSSKQHGFSVGCCCCMQRSPCSSSSSSGFC